MAAFSLTSSSIQLMSGTNVFPVAAAEPISAGQAVTQDGQVVDPAVSTKRAIVGVALQNASVGGIVLVLGSGCRMMFTDLVTQGQPVFAASGGQLKYVGDLVSGDRIIEVGISDTTNSIIITAEDKGVSKS